MLISSSFTPYAFANAEPVVHTDISFADIATYATPDMVTIKGKPYLAKVIPGGDDKILLIKNSKSPVTVAAKLTAGESIYYIQFGIKIDSFTSDKNIILNAGTTKNTLLNFSKNGVVYDSDGKKITGYTTDKWMDVAFMIDSTSKKGDIFIDGNVVKSRTAFPKSAVTGITFESTESSAETSWSIDYIRSYTADTLLDSDDFKYNINKDALADSSLELPPAVKMQNQLIVGYDFEDTVIGSVPDGFWIKNAPYVDEREDGKGRAFRVERTDVSVTTEHYVDLLINSSINVGFVEVDVYNPNNENNTELFCLRDKPGHYAKLVFLGPDGTVKTNNGTVVAKGVNKRWTNIAVKLDFNDYTYNVYIDRELVAENLSIPNEALEDYIQLIRFQIPVSYKKGAFWIDNMFAYTGEELGTYSEDMKKEREEARLRAEEEERLNGPKGEFVPVNPEYDYFTKVEEQISATPSPFLGTFDSIRKTYKDAFCVIANSPNVMMDGDKYIAPVSTLWESMKILVPVRTLGAAYGLEVGYDSETKTVSLGDKFKVKEGDTSFEYNGKKYDFTVPVKVANGITYIELDSFARNVMNSYVHESKYGITIVSKEKLAYQHATSAVRYLVGERPNAATLAETLALRYPDKTHPRVIASEADFERILKSTETDSLTKKWLNSAVESADFTVKSPLPKMEYDNNNTGVRLQNLPHYTTFLELYFAYRTTGDQKYIDAVVDISLATCNNYTTWGHNTHFLEVGQTCAAMGVAFDLFYDQFTKEQRDLIASKILEYSLRPAWERYFGNREFGGVEWPTDQNNWNMVVNKGIMMACAAIGDEYEPEFCMNVLEKSIRSAENMMTSFAPEGDWREGASYWQYAVSNTVIGLKSLQSTFGTDYGLSRFPGFVETGYYPFLVSGNAGAFAFNDAPRVFVINGDSCVFHIAKLANDPSLAGIQLKYMEKGGSNGGATYLLYYDPDFVAEAGEFELDKFYTAAQIATIRSDWGTNAVWAGFQAGANDLDHGHVDLGAFEYEANGVRFASEMGKDNYNLPGYWNTSVRNIYALRAEGHNVYVINPDMSAGQETKAHTTLKQICEKPQGTIYTIDLTPAYIKNVSSAQRGFMLSENRRIFTVQDEIVPYGNDEYYWFWHTVAEIDIAEDGKSVLLTNSNRTVRVYFDANVDFCIEKGLSLPLPTSPVVEGQLGNLKSTINKITVRFTSQAETPITFRATAVPEGCSFVPSEELTPISEWSIPDGEITLGYPTPQAILVDGKPIENFSPDKTEYTLPLYSVPDKMPVLSVEGDVEYEVKQPTMDDPLCVISVKSNTHPGWYINYYIKVEISTSLTKPADPELKIENVEVSAIPEDFNPPPHMLDNDFNTRWSAENTQWAVFDLGESKTVSGFGIAIYSGLARAQIMELYVSEDGVNYTNILKGRSSKLTAEMEYIEFNPVKARYVKLIGHGNSANGWNSITEIKVFGK